MVRARATNMGAALTQHTRNPIETTRAQLGKPDNRNNTRKRLHTNSETNIFPHFSNRKNAYVMIPPTYKDIKTWKDAINWVTSLDTEYILIDLETDPHNTIRYAFTPIRQRQYQLLAFYDNIYLYQRDYTGATISYEPINITYTYSDLIPQNMETKNDPNSTIRNSAILPEHEHPRRVSFWHGLIYDDSANRQLHGIFHCENHEQPPQRDHNTGRLSQPDHSPAK